MWFKPVHSESLGTPSILLFPDRIEENIHRMIGISGQADRLRPHVKTHKISEIVKLQIRLGIRRFKCATLAEVEMVAGAGGSDILLAYPLLGPGIGIWSDLMDRFPDCRLSVTVDSEASLPILEKTAGSGERKLGLFVDIDNGMHRTGIDPLKAVSLIHSIAGNKSFIFRGLHVYDGHIHDRDPLQRKVHCERDFEGVNRLLGQLEQEGIEVQEKACGGTPTFPVHASHPDRTLCPGTPLLWDAGYSQSFPDLDFLPAAVLATRVISKAGQRLCLDLGHKAVASEMNHPRVKFLELEPGSVINHSEEHLVIACPDADGPAIGEVVYALPMHICPTMALHEKVYVVRAREVTETWEVVARKRIYPL